MQLLMGLFAAEAWRLVPLEVVSDRFFFIRHYQAAFTRVMVNWPRSGWEELFELHRARFQEYRDCNQRNRRVSNE